VKKLQSREAATDNPSSKPAAHAAGQDLPPLQGWMLAASRVPGAHEAVPQLEMREEVFQAAVDDPRKHGK
jgi:hypothetical protein